MKKYAILAVALFFASLSFGQIRNSQVQLQTNTVYTSNSNILVALAPDLVPYPPALLSSNGQRYIKANTVNKGKAKSKSCYLKVTYQWKFDYELFTQKKIVQQFSIQALDPKAATSVIIMVPDNQISSNPPYGSKYVSVTLEVDGTNLVIESDEKNNIKQLSLPILP